MSPREQPLSPLDDGPGPAAALSRGAEQALRDRILRRARQQDRGLWRWPQLLGPLPLAATVLLALVVGGSALAAVRSWPALKDYFSPPASMPDTPPASGPVERADNALPERAAGEVVEAPAAAMEEATLEQAERSPPPAGRDALAHANRLRQQRRWRAAEQKYLEVLRTGPGPGAATAAALAAAELRLSKLKQPRGALGLFRRTLRTQPQGPLAEQARHGIALSQRALGDREGELQALRDLLREHPNSLMRPAAEARLRSLSAMERPRSE